MPSWQLDTYEAVAVGAAVAAGLCLLLLLFVAARLRALSRRVRRLAPASRVADQGAVDPRAMRHVAVVRYDAFGDMGGMLSFSAALCDDNGDGLVISSINGRSETRTYAKSLVGGQSDHSLSPEEKQAIADAREA